MLHSRCAPLDGRCLQAVLLAKEAGSDVKVERAQFPGGGIVEQSYLVLAAQPMRQRLVTFEICAAVTRIYCAIAVGNRPHAIGKHAHTAASCTNSHGAFPGLAQVEYGRRRRAGPELQQGFTLGLSRARTHLCPRYRYAHGRYEVRVHHVEFGFGQGGAISRRARQD